MIDHTAHAVLLDLSNTMLAHADFQLEVSNPCMPEWGNGPRLDLRRPIKPIGNISILPKSMSKRRTWLPMRAPQY